MVSPINFCYEKFREGKYL